MRKHIIHHKNIYPHTEFLQGQRGHNTSSDSLLTVEVWIDDALYRLLARVNRNLFESNVNDERNRTGEAAPKHARIKMRNRMKITNLISGT